MKKLTPLLARLAALLPPLALLAPRLAHAENTALSTEAPVKPQESATPSGAAEGANEPQKPAPKPEAKPEAPKEETYPNGKFEFGSYGRVRVAIDGRGGTGRSSNIIAYGSRLDEDSYSEFELRREDTWKKDLKTRVVTTLALFPPFFHFTGNPTQSIALRNLYAQTTYGKGNFWVGSRMYRGDDIYLLNFWPLDNQNTVGGGAGYTLGRGKEGDTMFAFHAGMQRLDNIFQTQQIQAVAPYGFGSVSIPKVDRPRLIQSYKITHFLRNGPGRTVFDGDDAKGVKLVAYGETHELAAGVQQDPLTGKDRALPSDFGWLAGAEAVYYTGKRDTYAQLFVRHARGIAAYDPLATPTSFSNGYKTSGAHETTVAIAGNVEGETLALQWGGYLRFFRDASEASSSLQKFDEGTLVVRPRAYVDDHFGVAVEGSYQRRRYAVPNVAATGQLDASVTRFGLFPFFSPAGRGSFKRPEFRLIYAVSLRDAGARSLYAAGDPFASRSAEHYLGLSVEWWFNSSSYP